MAERLPSVFSPRKILQPFFFFFFFFFFLFIVYKGDNSHEFLFAFLQTETRLKGGQL